MAKIQFLKVLVVFFIAFGMYVTFFAPKKSEAATPTKVTVSTHYYRGMKNLKYPQVSGLKSRTVQDKINSVLLNAAKNSFKQYVKLMNQEKYDKSHKYCTGSLCNYFEDSYYQVDYQSTGFMSISYHDTEWNGGAHPFDVFTVYNFSLTTGKQYTINDLLKTASNYTNVRNYAYNYLIHSKYKDVLLVSKNDKFVNKNTQFYFANGGIYLAFEQYDVCAYVGGEPIVKIPHSIYQ